MKPIYEGDGYFCNKSSAFNKYERERARANLKTRSLQC